MYSTRTIRWLAWAVGVIAIIAASALASAQNKGATTPLHVSLALTSGEKGFLLDVAEAEADLFQIEAAFDREYAQAALEHNVREARATADAQRG